MRKTLCLLISLVIVSSSFMLHKSKADEGDPDPAVELTSEVNQIWDELLPWLADMERIFNIKLEKTTAYRTLQATMPKLTNAVEEATAKRWGIVVQEVGNGFSRVIFTGTSSKAEASRATENQIGGWYGFGQIFGRFLGPLPAIWFLVNMNLLGDDILEYYLIDVQVNQFNINEEDAEHNADYLTDKLRLVLDPVCWNNDICIGSILNWLEKVKEHRHKGREDERNGRRRPLPVGGDDPYGNFIGTPGPGEGAATGKGSKPNVTTFCWVYGPIGIAPNGEPVYGWYSIPC